MGQATFREHLSATINLALAKFQDVFDEFTIKLNVIAAVREVVAMFEARDHVLDFNASTLTTAHVHVTQLATAPWVKVEFSPDLEESFSKFEAQCNPKSDEPDIIARIEAILARLDTYLNKLDRLFPASGNPLAFNTASPPRVIHHIYLAGPWDARITINTVADLLRIEGHSILSKWHEPRFDGRDGTPGVFHDKKDVEAYEMNGNAIDVASAMVVFPDIGPKGGRETWFEVARFLNGDFSSPQGRRLYVFTSKVLPLTLRVTKHPMTVISDKGGQRTPVDYNRALVEAFKVDVHLSAGLKS